MEYERIQKPSFQGGGGGGISPNRLRLMLLGADRRRKEEELEYRRSLRSEAPNVDDKCENTPGFFLFYSNSASAQLHLQEKRKKICIELLVWTGVGFPDVCKDVDMVCSISECSAATADTASIHQQSKDFAFANARIRRSHEDDPFDSDALLLSTFEFQRAERVQQHRPMFVPPFSKPAPSKWDDAQKWIASPTSNRTGKSAGVPPRKVVSGILGYGNRQCATKVLEVTEEGDTKGVDMSQTKKEVVVHRTVSWVRDPYPVVDSYAKPTLVLENLVADSAVCLTQHGSALIGSTAFLNSAPTGRSVSMRDMGTEMTPVASQDPSRTRTPVRTAAPIHSPTSPSTPIRAAPISSNAGTVDCQEDSCKTESTERELQMRTRKEIMVLGTQLGKPNIAARDNGEPASLKTVPDEQAAESDIEIRAAAWEEAEKAKYLARFKREEIKIQAWEDHQKAKTEAEMRNFEVEVERMRASAHDKLMNKVAVARHKAEEKRAAAEAKRNQQAARAAQQAEYIRRTGRVPPLSCWSWCR
ncbi:hypothetical protein Taro_020281 [Colocasia esculenta]|uniref:Remorin C-terminal domain-containing protein n=1 Tax=Colocasia esculenta TaxID=4460 RepID=A0A843V1W2_COLES|nr:hypothetical protein [Colocasia esculenta]